MNKNYIISMFIASLTLLVLKLSDLDINNLGIIVALEISFYIFVIIVMIISYIRLNKNSN